MTFEEYRNAVLEALGSSNVVNVRYFVNFRKAVLDMLDVEYETEDLRNEVKFRLKVLEGLVKGGGLSVDDANVIYFADYRKAVLDTLCVDYTIEDLRNEDRFREKVLGELSRYGGSSKEIEVPDDVESPETWTPNTKVSVKEKE